MSSPVFPTDTFTLRHLREWATREFGYSGVADEVVRAYLAFAPSGNGRTADEATAELGRGWSNVISVLEDEGTLLWPCVAAGCDARTAYTRRGWLDRDMVCDACHARESAQ